MKHRWPVILVLGLGLVLLPVAHAVVSVLAQTEVDYLLGHIGSSGCEFYRNGSWYDAGAAQSHLRFKYDFLAANNRINTAEDFIDKAATKSSLSGRAYQVRCSGGNAVNSSQWLLDALVQYRKSSRCANCHHAITRGGLGN
jgi:hypothetical protein